MTAAPGPKMLRRAVRSSASAARTPRSRSTMSSKAEWLRQEPPPPLCGFKDPSCAFQLR